MNDWEVNLLLRKDQDRDERGRFGSGSNAKPSKDEGKEKGKSGRTYTHAELKVDYRTVHTGGKESSGYSHPDVGNFTMK